MAEADLFDVTVKERESGSISIVTSFFNAYTKGAGNADRPFVMRVFFLESFKSILSNDSICAAITSDVTVNSERGVLVRLDSFA